MVYTMVIPPIKLASLGMVEPIAVPQKHLTPTKCWNPKRSLGKKTGMHRQTWADFSIQNYVFLCFFFGKDVDLLRDSTIKEWHLPSPREIFQ